VFIDALHNFQMQEPRFKQHDKKMDQTGLEIYILNRGTGVYRCFTQLPDARTKVRTTWQKVDQTGLEIYILNNGTGVYRCFTQLPDARTKVQTI
jgi:hypothetical protein